VKDVDGGFVRSTRGSREGRVVRDDLVDLGCSGPEDWRSVKLMVTKQESDVP
jgi:hypothetical protein